MTRIIDQRQQRHDPANKVTEFPDDPHPATPADPITPPQSGTESGRTEPEDDKQS